MTRHLSATSSDNLAKRDQPKLLFVQK